MNKNGLKIYSVIISVVTVLLIAAVIVMASSYSKNAGRDESLKQEQTLLLPADGDAQADVEKTQAAADNDESDLAGTADDALQAQSGPEEAEAVSDNEELNMSGVVGWEAGNDDMKNVIDAWKIMLSQADIDADIAFLGDSITIRGDFRPYFPDKKVVNLGCGGDTIRGVYNRSEMLSYVNPEKVFVMCGVNVLRNDNAEECKVEYAGLLNSIRENVPDADVYVMSILPMSQDWQDQYCTHESTEAFNLIIKELAEVRGMIYVDIYSAFETDGVMNPDYTVDGVHLSQAGYDKWMSEIYKYIYG